ncbi:MAG: hypothetical protein M1837_007175 [Sclerophora amabilis]|nr:MAG: hypothetical protein M1837_007175 [Sclerophora amabilis]
MPPPSPSAADQVNADQQAPLTDEDVGLLHLIITAAQELPQADQFPFRALFSAYDTVLKQHGLEPDHDAVYFRFLLRLGGVREVGSLYDKFESLLEELGIRIEFGENDNDNEVENVSGEGAEASPAPGFQEPPQLPITPQSRSRRASFSSFYEGADEATHISSRRARSQSPVSRTWDRLSAQLEGRPSTRVSTRATERTHSAAGVRYPKLSDVVRGRLTTREFARNLQRYQRKSRSISGQRNAAIVQAPEFAADDDDDEDGMSHFSPVNSTGISRQVERDSHRDGGSPEDRLYRSQHGLPPELLFHPSESQMSLDAETFYFHHIRSVARDCVSQWHSRASHVRPYHQNLQNIAISHDRSILLSQAFDTWRVSFYHKRQEAETNRFFAHLESRADKARNLYLLTKAFTHWAQCASDEVQRTSTARRHILRTKYFHAWREITAVNELKVRRFGLSKFLTQWIRRHRNVLKQRSTAIVVHQENLVKRIYWAWFWRFCEQRAPEWWAERIKMKTFSRWVEGFTERRARESWIEDVRKQKMLRICWRTWSDRTRQALSRQHEVHLLRGATLIENNWASWKKQTKLAPIARRLSTAVDWRIAYEVMSTWVVRTRMEQQSAKVNRQRIIRNAWTCWNDRLRWQTVAHRIDERLVLQSLYKWLLAERRVLLQRHLDQQLERRTLSTFMTRLSEKREQLSRCEEIVQSMKKKRTAKSVLARWGLQLELHRQRNQLANEVYTPRLAQKTLHSWIARSQSARALDRNAKDAEYYLVTTKILRKWQISVADSKREKRRNAYAQMRRKIKMNVARRVLTTWRARNAHCSEMGSHAEKSHQNHLLVVGLGYFDSWRARAAEVLELVAQAMAVRESNLLRHHVGVWRMQLQRQRDFDALSTYHAELHVLNQAAMLLRKLGMLAFQHSNHDRSAINLRTRNEKKHFRNVFRHWHERTAQSRGQKPATFSSALPSGRKSRRAEDQLPEGGTTAFAAEDWTAFDDGFDVADWVPSVDASSSATPLPGYLSTPSKRAVRAKALVKLSSTTPRTPSIRPFQQRLRSHYSTDRTSSAMASGSKDLETNIFGEGRRLATIERIEEVSSPSPGGGETREGEDVN